MDLDRILHPKKNFAELTDADIEAFLRERTFRSEHLNLEFKRLFVLKGNHKYDILEICKYIVAFSNEEGGLVIYGVADNIKDSAVPFPTYIIGLAQYPSAEDLTQWVTQRIHPLVQSPAIRLFKATGKDVFILKIPAGVNRPYCYHDPGTKAITLFKKTAAGIHELAPDEVRELYRTAILEQSAQILRAASQSEEARQETDPKLEKHRKWVLSKLENVQDFGYVSIYCFPYMQVNITTAQLTDFLHRHRLEFSEAIRFFQNVEVFQDGVSVGYFPTAIRSDIKSTERVTLYQDGLVAFDSQADTTMDRNKNLHPFWLAYEIQRHLQLAKALLEERGVEVIHIVLDLGYVENFVMRREGPGEPSSAYAGSHRPIEHDVRLSEIHAYNDREKRNIVSPIVKEIMDEVSRIFGLSETLRGVWDDKGYLYYVRGLENHR